MKIPEIKRVGIVGSGTMGSRIAYRCIVSGYETSLYDKYPEALDASVKKIRAWLEEKAKGGEVSPGAASSAQDRLKSCASLRECVRRADLVIETVPENLELKRQIFAQIDKWASPGALIATNSSSLPCSRIADVTGRPDKIFNINFSDPTHDLEVEVMKGTQTSNETIICAERFCRSMGMVPIVTLKEIMGFSFNRIWRAVKCEALHLVDQGYSNYEDIDRAWMLCFGTPFGPFGFMDIIGLDVVRDIEMQYYLESGEERDRPPRLLDDMIAQGRLGEKSGQGFYSHPNPVYEDPAWLRKEKPYDEDLVKRLDLKE